jgi:hypothetical protein
MTKHKVEKYIKGRKREGTDTSGMLMEKYKRLKGFVVIPPIPVEMSVDDNSCYFST